MRFPVLVAFVAAPYAVAAPVPKVKVPEVEVLPLATSLLPGERMRVFVRFTNRGQEDVFFHRDTNFSEPKLGTVVVEVKGPSDDEFRRPYDLGIGIKPLEEQDKGDRIAPGVARDGYVFLPRPDEEEKHPVFHEAGKWLLRARVRLYAGEGQVRDKVSQEVKITVAERPADELKRFHEAVKQLDRLWGAEKRADQVEQCREIQKLTDALPPSYSADGFRSDVLVFRLSLVRAGQSKETQEEVLKDIDAHLKTLPAMHRTLLCCRVAECLFDRKGKANTPERLAVAKEFLNRADWLPTGYGDLKGYFDEEEKKLKAKPAADSP